MKTLIKQVNQRGYRLSLRYVTRFNEAQLMLSGKDWANREVKAVGSEDFLRALLNQMLTNQNIYINQTV